MSAPRECKECGAIEQGRVARHVEAWLTILWDCFELVLRAFSVWALGSVLFIVCGAITLGLLLRL